MVSGVMPWRDKMTRHPTREESVVQDPSPGSTEVSPNGENKTD